jgi:hypothetical protein
VNHSLGPIFRLDDVDFHNFAFHHDVIASGLYVMSGTALIIENPGEDDYSNFSFVTQQMGCDVQNPGAELECMKRVDVRRLVNVVGSYDAANNGSASIELRDPWQMARQSLQIIQSGTTEVCIVRCPQ